MNISELVEKYKAHRNSFLASTYNETQLRNDFIDPLLKCLGWDVDNKKGKTHILRDVIQEEYIEIKNEETKKNPDYTLRINGTRKLFVEVKKPSVNILKSAKSAFQTRRYGWSANLGISVLTNFEHLIIYDCRFKPNDFDNEHVARYKVFSYEEYEKAFDEIKEIISYEAANSGALDDMFDVNTRVGETFDEYFLQQIEDWREKLAKTAVKNNTDLGEEDVNFIIQRLLNRIIFLRVCEDRTIEKYETIKGIKSYEELKRLFQKSDKKFNSGLFDFIDDTLLHEVEIDSDVLIEIFSDLYFPQSPYDFSVVDPTILSQIYERFLGQKIIIESGGTFHIAESPEVAASNGVVPTPKIIVEQIVNDTLTPLTEGKTFSELCNLKIADICCGSGTFLISSYDFLIGKILERIIEEEIDDPALIYETDEGLTLTLKAKRMILENNLFGVDINPYAVEVAEFSLLLKLLEGENEASVNNFIQEHSEKVLPNLKSNIKCGNTLVDNKFFKFMPEALYNDEILYNINPFEWGKEFPDIMDDGGFDAIIGNPPYVRIQNMKKYSPEEIKYYQSKDSEYTVAKKDTVDKYFLFIERAINLLKSTGLLGYIIPHKFFITKGGKELRKLIAEKHQISKIINFGVTQVFPGRSTYTAILIIQVNKMDHFKYRKVNGISAEELYSEENTLVYKSEKYNSDPWIFLSPETETVFNKLTEVDYEKLGEITDISVGLQTSRDKVYIFIPEGETSDTYIYSYKGKRYEIEKSICRSAIYDLSFNAFESIEGNAQIIFPYKIVEEEAYLIEEETLKSVYPLAWSYLNEFKEDLEKRSLQGNNPKWYQYGRSQSLAKFHNTEKLIWPVLATKAPYVIDKNNLLFTGGGNGPYYGLINQSNYSLNYFLGILSHPVIESMVKASASEFRGSYYSHGKQFIEKIPIKKIDFTNQDEINKYNMVVETVENIIINTDKVKNEKNTTRKSALKRRLNALFNRLTQVINDLYKISDADISTVLNDEMLTVALGEEEQ
ncbi:eco57I restriction-modification methylase family protein [Bacillus licheniformis]|uniref:Eco57I restriction-modification methylase domain-containing protein n=1 Tax=Bacillus licheniformis TaxID=1402 RepID=UPI0005CE5132|nr:N-6 DNA methylase [Bacillus licheniformis]KJE30395.1 eco57I restriction-modification methylase family protein [Bacillus licheniformis]OAZ60206.1 Site-specific DNA-methyltransferase (adenine-specific) [Bacillus licheniformis]TWM95665.1 Type IIS restriction enzyme Eco57I [Bacillus licheniformis]